MKRKQTEGVRLLRALAWAGARARPQGAHALLLTPEVGPALRFRRAAADALVEADLAAWSGAELHITEAGRARARRDSAPPGLAFLAQHAELVCESIPGGHGGPERSPGQVHPVPKGGRTGVIRDVAESPLAWLRHRRGRDGAPLIDAARFEAGERLRRDLTLAQTMPRVTADWSAALAPGRGTRRGAGDLGEAALDARRRVDQAISAIGPDLAGLLIDVCGFLKGLEHVERERGWPQRSAKVVLGIALGRLAAHYGLSPEARGPEHGRIRSWKARGDASSMP